MNPSADRGRAGRAGAVLVVVLLLAAALVAWATWSPGPPDGAPGSAAPTPAAHAPAVATPDGERPRERLEPRPADATPRVEPAAGAHALRGTVRAADGAPLAGATVEVELASREGRREVARATSAAGGGYAAALDALDALEPLDRAGSRVFARASAPGRQPQEKSLAVARADAGALSLDFELAAGSELSGRAVDAAGRAIADAEVALIVAGRAPDGSPLRRVAAETRSRGDGRFSLGFVSAGRVEVLARADGAGTAHREVDLDAGAGRSLGDLVLAGAGALSGHARYPDRSPAVGLELWAVGEELDPEKNPLVAAARRATLAEREGGLSYGRATTDAEGAFTFAGLRAGRYSLLPAKPDVVFEPRRGHYALGTSGIEISIEVHRLRVRIVDGAGRPLPGAVVACTEMEERSPGELSPGMVSNETASGPGAVAIFHVQPEVPIGLTATLSGARTAEDVLVVAQGQWEVEHVLALVPAGAEGRLQVLVGGAPLVRGRVSLLSPTTTRRIEALDTDAEGWLPPLAPGSYLVEAGSADADGPLSTWFPVRTRGSSDTCVSRPLSTTTGSRVRTGNQVESGPSASAEPASTR